MGRPDPSSHPGQTAHPMLWSTHSDMQLTQYHTAMVAALRGSPKDEQYSRLESP